MLLLVDAGNSRIKWALADAGESGDRSLGVWAASGSVERNQVPQLTGSWAQLNVSRVLFSNVAGQAMREALEQAIHPNLVAWAARASAPVPVQWWPAAPAFLAGVRNGYRDPAQLGFDRFAAAIGAHALFPGQALIVATCGTATTIDALTADGMFVGGMILPGLALMAGALAANTALLPKVAMNTAASTPFADNTDDAIICGCVAAQVGAIERALAAHARGHRPVQCILSGGAAALIAPQLPVPCERVENLVLTGLQVIAYSQQG